MICSDRFEINIPDKNYLRLAKTISKIETYYFINNCFLPKNYILKNANKLKNIKTYIIHGKKDMVCPPYQAIELYNKLNKKELFLDKNGGHSLGTGNMKSILKKVIKKNKKTLNFISTM